MRMQNALWAAILLSGCIGMGSKLDDLKSRNPMADGDFSQALAAEYLAYAEARQEEGRPLRAGYFAGKGLAALRGEAVELEKKPALEESRQALLAVLTPDIKEIAPAKAARAQLMFDCWAEKEGLCKEGFATALIDLQFIADALVHGEDNRFTVTFPGKSAALDAQAASILDIVAGRVKQMGEYEVEIVPAVKKGALPTQRRLAIEKGLIARGVNAGRIHSHRNGKGREVDLNTHKKGDANSVTVSIQTYGQPKEARTP